MAKVKLSASLKRFTNNKMEFNVDASSVLQAIQKLESEHPDLKLKIISENSEVRRFVRLYLDQVDITDQDLSAVPLSSKQVLNVLTALAGG